MERVDLKLGFSCNNRCEFCVQGNKREHFGPREYSQIHADLEEGRRNGAAEVVFTGGEPTLQKTLLPAVQLARQLGYSNIQIQTNGRALAYEPLCRKLIAAGATEFSPALHGAMQATHDGLTRATGSHKQTIAGIRNLVRLGQRVITNTVITSRNYRELPDLARLFVDLGVRQFQFAYVHLVGSAGTNIDWLAPRKADVLEHVRAGLDIGKEAGVPCMTEAIPYCLMQGYEDFVAERIIPPSMIYDADKFIEDYDQYRRSEGKAKRGECRRCCWDAQCEGPWREYPERFGWDEMVPVAALAPRTRSEFP